MIPSNNVPQSFFGPYVENNPTYQIHTKQVFYAHVVKKCIECKEGKTCPYEMLGDNPKREFIIHLLDRDCVFNKDTQKCIICRQSKENVYAFLKRQDEWHEMYSPVLYINSATNGFSITYGKDDDQFHLVKNLERRRELLDDLLKWIQKCKRMEQEERFTT